MKTITLLFTFLLAIFAWQINGQTLNQAANWPNTNWTLNVIEHTGTSPQDIEADPTVDANFAYDDDDTGSGSHDVIAAESPVIDLTAAHTVNENFIRVAGDYVYRFFSSGHNQYLAVEYYDADTDTWELWHQFENESTPSAPTDDYCSGTHVSYETLTIDISAFTATQLNGFKYRFIYNDNTTGGVAYNYGFCFGSPTISSSNIGAPIATFTVNPDCANSQFSVVVNVTSLGGGTSVTVTDDQSSPSQSLTAPGNVTFGPYSSGTAVEITVTNDSDTTLVTTETVQYYCPPANDNCDSASSLTLDPDTCINYVSVSNFGSTDSGVPAPSCGAYNPTTYNGDLWFTITIPTGVTEITLNVNNVNGLTSVAGTLYSGDCVNLSEVSCTQFSSGWPWLISDLTPGDTYYLRVWDYNNDQLGTFDLCGHYDASAIGNNQIAGFNYYPNPVNHTLNLSAKDTIEMISISNVMGQEVLNLNPNTTQTQVDMSQLQNGIYFVKAQVNGQLTAFKVVKK